MSDAEVDVDLADFLLVENGAVKEKHLYVDGVAMQVRVLPEASVEPPWEEIPLRPRPACRPAPPPGRDVTRRGRQRVSMHFSDAEFRRT
ncbi:hypothetical protein ACWGGS_36905 [Streptomyces decoyicus]